MVPHSCTQAQACCYALAALSSPVGRPTHAQCAVNERGAVSANAREFCAEQLWHYQRWAGHNAASFNRNFSPVPEACEVPHSEGSACTQAAACCNSMRIRESLPRNRTEAGCNALRAEIWNEHGPAFCEEYLGEAQSGDGEGLAECAWVADHASTTLGVARASRVTTATCHAAKACCDALARRAPHDAIIRDACVEVEVVDANPARVHECHREARIAQRVAYAAASQGHALPSECRNVEPGVPLLPMCERALLCCQAATSQHDFGPGAFGVASPCDAVHAAEFEQFSQTLCEDWLYELHERASEIAECAL